MSAVRAALRDLMQRRLWPVALALIAVPVVLAVVLAGGPAKQIEPLAPAPAVPPVAAKPAVAVQIVPSPARADRGGAGRDPFRSSQSAPAIVSSAPAGPPVSSHPSSHSTTAPSTKTSPTPGSPSSSTPHSSPAPPTSAPAPKAVDTARTVSVRFGRPGDVTTHDGLKRLGALPALGPAIAVFSGAVGGGAARFELAAGARVSGAGTCHPSAADCQSVDLSTGDKSVVAIGTRSYRLDLLAIETAPVTHPEQTIYGTRVRFGAQTGAHAHAIARLAALGGSADPAAQYLGVAADGQTAGFLIGPHADSSGGGTCVDGDACRMIALRAGQSRTITVDRLDGETVSYRLDLVSVRAHVVGRATATRSHQHVDPAGRAALRTLIGDPRIASVLGRYSFSQRLGVVLPSTGSAAARP